MGKADGIYEQYADLIYKYLYRLTENPDISEELTQEVFYQALKTIKNFKGESKMSTWLCQIAKHSWYKYLEKKSKSRYVPIEDISHKLSDDNNPEKLIIESDNRISLYKQIHILNDPYKEVVMLRILGDLSFREIGEVLGKTEGWARITFHRAKIILIERSNENEN